MLNTVQALVAELAGEGLLQTVGVRMLLQVALALAGRGEVRGAQRAGVRPGQMLVAVQQLLCPEATIAKRAHKAGALVFPLTTLGPIDETRSLQDAPTERRCGVAEAADSSVLHSSLNFDSAGCAGFVRNFNSGEVTNIGTTKGA